MVKDCVVTQKREGNTKGYKGLDFDQDEEDAFWVLPLWLTNIKMYPFLSLSLSLYFSLYLFVVVLLLVTGGG